MFYYFSVSGISICLDIPFPVKISAESVPFLQQSKPEHTDVTVSVTPVALLPKPPESAIYESGTYFSGMSVFYCDHPEDDPYARLTADPASDTLMLEYRSEFENRFTTSHGIINHMGLETLLLMQRVLLLHSSFIRLKSGYGILFSAPSGTGKSTQAALWHKHRQADIINGDRAGLCKPGNSWTAWGLPYAGTSGIYRNESAPIQSIVCLRQSKENVIRRLKSSDAMWYLYPELTLHRWEPASVETAMDLLMNLVSEVPVFLLECRPDEESVAVLEEVLKEVIS